MLKQYIGPHDEVKVVIAGNEIGIVKQGESISVPDELAESVGWAETLWQDFKPAPAVRNSKSEGSEA